MGSGSGRPSFVISPKKLAIAAVLGAVIAGGIWGTKYLSAPEKGENPPSSTKTEEPQNQAAAPTSAPAQAPQSAPSRPPLTEEEFSTLTKKTLSSLPTIEEIRKLSPQEVHGTPAVVLQAAAAVGEITQAIHDNPRFAEEGLRFYSDCAARTDVSTPIRASCLADFDRLKAKTGLSVARPNVSSDLQELAGRL